MWTNRGAGGVTDLKAIFRNPGPGAARLQDIALRIAVVNYDAACTVESLQNVPWCVAKRIWDQMNSRSLMNLCSWLVFIRYADEVDDPDKIFHHTFRIIFTGLDLATRTLRAAPNPHFITFLSITRFFAPERMFQELEELPEFPNLGALHLDAGDGRRGTFEVDKQILQAWANRAERCGGFPKLKLLVSRCLPTLGLSSLDLLAKLPALEYCIFADSLSVTEDEQGDVPGGWEFISRPHLDQLASRLWMDDSISAGLDDLYRELIPPSPGAKREPFLDLRYGSSLYPYFARDISAIQGVKRVRAAPLLPGNSKSRPSPSEDNGPKRRKIRQGIVRHMDDLLQDFESK
ncbi:hypothetical protein EJ06DRAFT_39444 [Trichodelitschia bisporula]|uniref:Uncharacterized protein n=1 Tax=Trichodelitschia bisporula TaxID=703511 RepID=A0A6G1HVN1_9PEZI|nr:hypothetical protein EJ06DRAFT_39444 [Trichodelitschia bisporula]